VAIAGAAPCLSDEVEIARNADVVVAASTAADALRDRGVDVDCMVTDLDKNPETAAALTHEGVPVAAHAPRRQHPRGPRVAPRFADEATLATTQAAPLARSEILAGSPTATAPPSSRTTSALVASCSRGGTSTTRTWTR